MSGVLTVIDEHTVRFGPLSRATTTIGTLT